MPTSTTTQDTRTRTSTRTRARTTGYLFALAAGATWGTTGPLSTALYAEGAQLTQVGFWRVALAVLGFAIYGLLFKRDIYRIDRYGLILVTLGGGALVALFEVAFQFAIAGVGVAGAVALLYTAPVFVAVLGRVILKEALTPLRVLLAFVVMFGVWLTVNGGADAGGHAAASQTSRVAGIVGGLLAAISYTGTTLLARHTVPRYGATRVLFYELLGGTAILAILVPLMSGPFVPPATISGWTYVALLGIGSVLAANFFFFAAVKRIDAAPTAVAASIEPLVGALLALLLFGQQLLWFGWLGLALVVAGVGGGYKEEAVQ